ncbi:MAG TPA: TonB-dependent receptor [Candidatus Angelobacter sp.]|nr:TonB-dependent receptor [Candidatus Angelobacter sp.]
MIFRRSRVGIFLSLGLILFLGCSVPLAAQISSSTGAIRGTVVDPSGAAVSGAKVALTNTNTGSTQETSTQSEGSYNFPFLTPGEYSIAVEFKGFQRAVAKGIVVEVTKITVANIALEIGSVTNEVMVNAADQQVDTSTATTGDVIDGQLIRALSLPTRNFLFLTELEPGVSAVLVSPAAAGRGTPSEAVAGQRATENNFVLDGVDANTYGNNNFSSVPVPNPDAVQEFRVNTSLYDATQGRESGGNVNVVLRSGTKDFHGSLFEFNRDTIFNANDFFFNKNGVKRPVLNQNQFGFDFGGPVPKIHETFFFASYQGFRQKNGVSGGISGPQPVLPATRDAASLAAAFFPSGLPAGESIDPVAVAWLNQKGPYGGSIYPSGVGASVGQLGTFSFSSPVIFNEDQFASSLDHQFGQNNRLSAKLFWADAAQLNPIGGGVSLGQGQSSPLNDWHAALSDTHTFNSSLVNELRAGFTLVHTAAKPIETPTSAIGMTRFNSGFFKGTPGVFFGNGQLSGLGINTNNDQNAADFSYTIGNTTSWTHGKHTVRYGGEFRRYQFNISNNFASRGALVFLTFQDFLTGNPFQTFVGTGATTRGFRAYDLSFFGQDDYHLTRRLTLNLGVRWDYLTPSVDVGNRIGNFDPALLPTGCAQTGGACLRAGFISPAALPGFGTPGVSGSTLESVDKKNFSPRLGFAYDVRGNGRLSLRGGYGIYYIRTSGQTLLQGITGVPFFQLSSLLPFPDAPDSLANPFPALPTPDKFPILPAFPQFTGFSAGGTPLFNASLLTLNPVQRNVHTPYDQAYNLGVQYEFHKGWVADFGYIGSKAIKLLNGQQLNSALLVNAANPGAGGLTLNSSRNANARVPVVGFSTGGLNEVTDSGVSWYNGAVASVRHAFGHGLNLKANYTFSKSLDDGSGSFSLLGNNQDLGNSGGNQFLPILNKGRSVFNQTHRIVVTFYYELPGPKHGWMGQALGGWALSGSNIFQSGFPFSVVTNAPNLQGVGNGVARADLNCTGNLTAGGSVSNTYNNYINTFCFSAPPTLPAGTVITNVSPQLGPGNGTFTVGGFGSPAGNVGSVFGNSGRNILNGPFQNREDFSILKTFPTRFLREGSNLEFRAEIFKLFNTPIFANPSNVVGTSTFGQISSTSDTTGRVMQFALKLNF